MADGDVKSVDLTLGDALDEIDDFLDELEVAETGAMPAFSAESFGELREGVANRPTAPLGLDAEPVRPTLKDAVASPSELRARLQSRLKTAGRPTLPTTNLPPPITSAGPPTAPPPDAVTEPPPEPVTEPPPEPITEPPPEPVTEPPPGSAEEYSEDETAAAFSIEEVSEDVPPGEIAWSELADADAPTGKQDFSELIPASVTPDLADAPTGKHVSAALLAPPLPPGDDYSADPTEAAPLPSAEYSEDATEAAMNVESLQAGAAEEAEETVVNLDASQVHEKIEAQVAEQAAIRASGALVAPPSSLPPLDVSEIVQTRSGPDVTVISEGEEPSGLAWWQAAAIPAVGGAVAWLAAAGAVRDVWPTAMGGAGLFVGAGGIAFVLAALLAGSRRNLPTHFGLTLAVVAVTVVSAAAWTLPDVRASLTGVASESPQTFQAMLEDSSRVASAGCARYASLADNPDWFLLLSQTMEARPELAEACLEAMPKEALAPLVDSLQRRWTRSLHTEEGGACATATAMSKLPVSPDVVGARLLECTLSGTDAAKPCCAAALRASLAGPEHWPARLRGAAEHFQQESTPVDVFSLTLATEPTVVEEFADLNVTGVKAQSAAFEYVCESILDGDRGRVSRHLTAALAGQCDVDVGRFSADEQLWPHVCETTITALRADRTLPPLRATCDNAEAALVARAIEFAQNIIEPAAFRRFDRRFSRGLDVGFATKLASGDVEVGSLTADQRRTYLNQVSQKEEIKKPWDNSSEEKQSIFGTVRDARERPPGAKRRPKSRKR